MIKDVLIKLNAEDDRTKGQRTDITVITAAIAGNLLIHFTYT